MNKVMLKALFIHCPFFFPHQFSVLLFLPWSILDHVEALGHGNEGGCGAWSKGIACIGLLHLQTNFKKTIVS